MRWRIAWKTVATAVAATLMSSELARAEGVGARDGARPNIIVILADDLGYGDLGVQGGRDVMTPNIDRLAAGGVRMTDFYANHPVCAPSRAAMMLGKYQHRFGFEHNPSRDRPPAYGLPTGEQTLPERLKARGYATAMFGKWHLGWNPNSTPTARGFDTFYGFLEGSFAYTADAASGGKNAMRGVEPTTMPAHTTEAFTQEAVAFIDQNKDRPFFIYASYNAVHAPLQSTRAYLDRVRQEPDPKRRNYLAMLAALDDGVGEIVRAVERNGLSERTLIVFTSDNGGPTWQTTSANGALNGVKGLTLEGGIRVPAIFRWKGVLPEGRAVSSVGVGMDVTATALTLAGAPVEGLDGVDLTPILKGATTSDAHRQLFWRTAGQGGMREGPWKLVKAEDDYYLFDLATDLGERRDLASVEPARLARMKADWLAWSASMQPPRWGPLNQTAALPGKVKALVRGYVNGEPVDPRPLLYGGGPE